MTRPLLDICLVSEQPLPNYLPALLADRPRKVVALVSPQMRARSRHAGLLQALGQAGIEVEERQTEAYDIVRVREDVLQVLGDHAQWDCRCNLTGGTKLMTVALFEVARERGLAAYYVDTQEDRLLHLLPEHRVAALPSLLSIEPYLVVYDYQVLQRDAPVVTAEELELARWLTANANSQQRSLGMLVRLAHCVGPDRKADIRRNLYGVPRDFGAFLQRFERAGVLERRGDTVDFLDAANLNYVNGRWLEEYTYHCVRHCGAPVTDAACSLKVKSKKDVENELDVAFCARNRLFLVECKARSFKGKKGSATKEEGAAPAYKLDSLRDVVSGTFGRAMLVSYYELPQAVCRRLSDLRIRYLHGPELHDLEQSLRAWVRQP